MTEHFEIDYDASDPEEMIIAHCRGDVKMSIQRAVKELNHLEDRRKQLMQDKLELQQECSSLWEVVDGVRAYFKLKEKDYERW